MTYLIYGKKILKTQASNHSGPLHFALKVEEMRLTRDTRSEQSRKVRELLKNYLSQQGSHFDSIEIESYHHLQQDPSRLVSLTHTQGASMVCMALETDHLHAVGVDIEWQSRKINPAIRKFFVNSKDDQIELLSLWTLKEACFKALAPLLKSKLSLKQIWIHSNCFGMIGSPHALGEIFLWTQESVAGSLLCAIAATTLRPGPFAPN